MSTRKKGTLLIATSKISDSPSEISIILNEKRNCDKFRDCLIIEGNKLEIDFIEEDIIDTFELSSISSKFFSYRKRW